MRISDWSSDVCSSDLAFDETATERFQRLSYDLDGRTTFASYLGTTDALSTGFWTDYDALGRVIARSQDSEKGLLTTLSSYLSNARIQVVNPRGMQTTISYMAYGQPSTDWTILIVQPEGAYTDKIGRTSCRERGCQYV